MSSVTEFIRNEIEEKNEGQAFFIGLQKVFHTLGHKVLMIQLEKHILRETFFPRGKTPKYLSDWYQIVCENGNHLTLC